MSDVAMSDILLLAVWGRTLSTKHEMVSHHGYESLGIAMQQVDAWATDVLPVLSRAGKRRNEG
jgi:hypothetical protein